MLSPFFFSLFVQIVHPTLLTWYDSCSILLFYSAAAHLFVLHSHSISQICIVIRFLLRILGVTQPKLVKIVPPIVFCVVPLIVCCAFSFFLCFRCFLVFFRLFVFLFFSFVFFAQEEREVVLTRRNGTQKRGTHKKKSKIRFVQTVLIMSVNNEEQKR